MTDLDKKLHEALIRLGCDRDSLNFDARSDIKLDFTDIGSVYIVPEAHGGAWIWALVPDVEVSDLGSRALTFLEHLLAPTVFMASGAMSARPCDHGIQVGGLIGAEVVEDSESLGNALVHFHDRMSHLLESLK